MTSCLWVAVAEDAAAMGDVVGVYAMIVVREVEGAEVSLQVVGVGLAVIPHAVMTRTPEAAEVQDGGGRNRSSDTGESS